MKIGLHLYGIGTFNMGIGYNVQGDELVAMGLQEYLRREEGVEEVILLGPEDNLSHDLDVVIHFNPLLKNYDKVKNVLYFINVFPEPYWKGGTIGQFNENKLKYDGFMFTCKKVMEKCCEGLVIPFATDPERFNPQSVTEGFYNQVPISFVGNDLRGETLNKKYFYPAIPLGLKIWGKTPWQPPLEEIRQGGLPLEDMAKLYTNSIINLNVHILEHIEYGTINARIFDILACGGFILSDYSQGVEEVFGDSIAYTEGDDDTKNKIAYYFENEEERKRRSEEGKKIVLSDHTYEVRAKSIIKYLKEIL